MKPHIVKVEDKDGSIDVSNLISPFQHILDNIVSKILTYKEFFFPTKELSLLQRLSPE